jgi:hypothetical protein
VYEIAWTRWLTLFIGHTTAAASTVAAAFLGGLAAGAAIGGPIAARVSPRQSLLAYAALEIGVAVAAFLLPHEIEALMPLLQWAYSDGAASWLFALARVASCFLIVFIPATSRARATRHRGAVGVYAVNTIGAVSGSLAAGFLLIPALGLQRTRQVAGGCLIAASLLVVFSAVPVGRARIAGVVAAVAASVLLVVAPAWDRDLLASGAYMYARFVPKDLDLEPLLKAGTLLYYREGASATVSVKRLTGTTTLAVDGKTDASNRGDMLTQKLAAHLPLLMHDAPRSVGIIRLGSGVTVGSALSHPIDRADVLESHGPAIPEEGVATLRFRRIHQHGTRRQVRDAGRLASPSRTTHTGRNQRRFGEAEFRAMTRRAGDGAIRREPRIVEQPAAESCVSRIGLDGASAKNSSSPNGAVAAGRFGCEWSSAASVREYRPIPSEGVGTNRTVAGCVVRTRHVATCRYQLEFTSARAPGVGA